MISWWMRECAVRESKVPQFGWLFDQVIWRALKRQLSSSTVQEFFSNKKKKKANVMEA